MNEVIIDVSDFVVIDDILGFLLYKFLHESVCPKGDAESDVSFGEQSFGTDTVLSGVKRVRLGSLVMFRRAKVPASAAEMPSTRTLVRLDRESIIQISTNVVFYF